MIKDRAYLKTNQAKLLKVKTHLTKNSVAEFSNRFDTAEKKTGDQKINPKNFIWNLNQRDKESVNWKEKQKEKHRGCPTGFLQADERGNGQHLKAMAENFPEIIKNNNPLF